jgi:hypothetical protein
MNVKWVYLTTWVVGLCFWLLFARIYAPLLVKAGYEQRSLAVVNQVFEGRSIQPVDQYLKRWEELCRTWTVALIMVLCVPLGAAYFGLDRLMARSSAVIPAGADALILWTSAVLGILILVVSLRTGAIQDYRAFESIWAAVLRGEDPWNCFEPGQNGLPTISGAYAYGAAFNVLSILTLGGLLLPKAFFAAVRILWSVSVARSIAMSHPTSKRAPILALLACLLNPFFWVEIVLYGHFDILHSVLMLCAICLSAAELGAGAGAAIGLGTLLKFLPALILPVLAVTDRKTVAVQFHGPGCWRRIRADVLTGCLGTVALGFGTSYLVWGTSVFQPLFQVISRGSALLSVFHYLKVPYSPLALAGRQTMYLSYLVNLVKAVVALFGGLALLRYVLGRIDAATACALTALSALTFYNVGFPQ